LGYVKAERFTLDVVTWRPWIETVEQVGATPEQLAALEKHATNREYFATLAHDAPALRERTALFNAIMYGHAGAQGGASRADRELAAVATSRANGCVYCASVHARLHAQLAKDATLIRRLLDGGVEAEQPERERAVIDYAVKLARDPAGMTAADLAPLRAAGYNDVEILDINNAAAVFAWANRLMLTLGEGTVPRE
jgi:uncharacterized peroxidase-related enzyme